jgi:hypothetical protein
MASRPEADVEGLIGAGRLSAVIAFYNHRGTREAVR